MAQDDLQDLIAGGPTTPGSEGRYLGVPEGYAAVSERPAAPQTRYTGQAEHRADGGFVTEYRQPRYLQGAEFTPAGLSAQRIARLQLDLAASGLMGAKPRFRLGEWDEPSRNAYRKLLGFANQTGIDYGEALARLAAAPLVGADGTASGGSGGGGDVLPPVRLTNPDDLRAVIQQGARQHIGRRLRDEEVERIVAAYQTGERQSQQAAYQASQSGGTFTDMPNPTAFAEQQLEQTHGLEKGGHDIARAFDMFLEIINRDFGGV